MALSIRRFESQPKVSRNQQPIILAAPEGHQGRDASAETQHGGRRGDDGAFMGSLTNGLDDPSTSRAV